MLENKEILYMNEVNETKLCNKCGREGTHERKQQRKWRIFMFICLWIMVN